MTSFARRVQIAAGREWSGDCDLFGHDMNGATCAACGQPAASQSEDSTMTDTATYVRGTITHRVKTARVKGGDRLLTDVGRERPFGILVYPAAGKMDSRIRSVDAIWSDLLPAETAGDGFRRRRAQRVYTIRFADGSVARNLNPIETWDAVTPSGLDEFHPATTSNPA